MKIIIASIFPIMILFLKEVISNPPLEMINMNPEEQLMTFDFTIDADYYSQSENIGFVYGIWSKYNPLSKIIQAEIIGNLESTCFHYHNVAERQTKNINLIYYVCIDWQNQEVLKVVNFSDDSGHQHSYKIQISKDLFENIWYYFQIASCPYLKKFQLLIIQSPTTIIAQEGLDINYPFADRNLVLTFGGGVNSLYHQTPIKYPYFPGKLYLYPLDQNAELDFTDLSYLFIDLESVQYGLECECNLNENTLIIQSYYVKNQDKMIYLSEYPNCDYFQLAGWIKIDEIISDGSDFSYKLIKITTNSQNIKLTDDNLSPFNLIYYFSNSGNRIIFTTYSYTFPSVNLDFSSNPFLITNEFQINNNIFLWHYLSVQLLQDTLTVIIEFHEDSNIYSYQTQSPILVHHFNTVNFQIQFGNLYQLYHNSLNIEFYGIQFFNCDSLYYQQKCYFSCQECDGPTRSSCLSCAVNSNRVYYEDRKQCLCPFNSIDRNDCLSLSTLNLETYISKDLHFKCPFGYFESDSDCLQCPQVVEWQQVNCLDCLLNPKQWSKMLYCTTSMVSKSGKTYTEVINTMYFILDGINVKHCNSCVSNCLNNDCLYSDQIMSSKVLFCSKDGDLSCYNCNILNCKICKIQQNQLICITCNSKYKLINQQCIRNIQNICFSNCAFCSHQVCLSCFPPYYLTHDKSECKLCSIMNCQYCFQYLANDLIKNTLYKNFDSFQGDDMNTIYTGCSLCVEGFNFDFTLGQCIRGMLLAPNCLRSFVNLAGVEICLVAGVNDFTVAPQITGCQNYLDNCQQCLLTPNQFIKCIICANGYSASVATGHCTPCDIQYSTSCIEGDRQLNDEYVQLIQSFIMQLTLDRYFYPRPTLDYLINKWPLSCQDGYQRYITRTECQPYCNKECRSCQYDEKNMQFICIQCPTNYYGDEMLSINERDCLSCSSLCLTCLIRTQEEIQIININFLITDQNIAFTYKCLKAINDQNIIIDSELQIAKYCFNKECNSGFQQQVIMSCQNHDYNSAMLSLENDDQVQYLNNIGAKEFTISILLPSQLGDCDIDQGYSIQLFTNLKKLIFPLQQTFLELMATQELIVIFNTLQIREFDSVILLFLLIKVEHNNYLEFENNQLPIDLTIENSIFLGNQGNFLVYEISLQLYKNLILKNIQLKNINLKDSIWLEYLSDSNEQIIEIELLIIDNCNFENVTLLSFSQHSKQIVITRLIITNSNFFKSTLIKYNSIIYNNLINLISNLTIIACSFQNSTLVYNNARQTLLIDNLIIQNSTFNNSIIVNSLGSLSIQQVKLEKNYFLFSFFFSLINKLPLELNNLEVIFSNIQIETTTFLHSKIVYVYLDNTLNHQTSLQLINISHFNLTNAQILTESFYLYDISCNNLKIKNISILESPNFLYFNIYHTAAIEITDILLSNQQQNQKISLLSCLVNTNILSTLFFIQGLQEVSINNVSIVNQASVDSSLIQIWSDLLYQPSSQEIIKLSLIKFAGNILLKKQLGNIFSLISIYSNKVQDIKLSELNFKEVFFHQSIDDSSNTAASLIYINSPLSTVTVQDILLESNALTNSSISFISISSLVINISFLTVRNSNFLDNKIWSKYYEVQGEISDGGFNELMQEMVVLNQGGICTFASSQLIFHHGYFNNLIGLGSVVFRVITQGEGRVAFSSMEIINASTVLKQTIEAHGCISISSMSSLLNLQVFDTLFNEVHNRIGSAIFTISPSLQKNIITLSNVTALNSISFANQIVRVQFSQAFAKNNIVTITKLNVTQTLQGWNNYLKQIYFLTDAEIKKIKNENAMINLQECSVIINNFYIHGVLISPILLLQDVQIVKLQNIQAESCEVLYSFSLFIFLQSQQTSNLFVFQQVLLRKNTQLFQQQGKLNSITTEIVTLNLFSSNCNSNQLITFSFEKSFSLDTLIKLLSRNANLEGSLISIIGLSNTSRLLLKEIIIFNNDCQFCYDGIISLRSSSPLLIYIEHLYCQNNIIQQFGCLLVAFESPSEQFVHSITIKNSFFINNNGTYGAGLWLSSSNFQILFSMFLQNNCIIEGGALFLENIQSNSIFKNSQILFNSAKLGGGISMRNKTLSEEGFINSLLFFNKASQFTNNLIDFPNNLVLRINNKEFRSISSIFNDQVVSVLSLPTFEYLSQDKILQSSILILPSNQRIIDYKIFNPSKRIFMPFIIDFTLLFVNSRNEILTGNLSDQCYINIIGTETRQQVLSFNLDKNGFDLGSLTFSFDPYSTSPSNQMFVIQINCSFLNNNNTLLYQIPAKTFMCQLGEFYANQGCQRCEPSFGFYSVTYNSTKCSIFDKAKFDNITSNQIKLKPGFWRPSYESDLTEICFKNQDWCLGGWYVNNDLCYIGHIGGLCEECDIYNIQGNGNYFKANTTNCSLCKNGNIVPFIFISLWSFFSIMLTLKSIRNSNQVFKILKVKTRLYEILFRQTQDIESILLKMLLNYLQIFSAIFSFNITLGVSFDIANQVSSPSYFMANNIDCYLREIEYIHLIYLRIIATLIFIILQILILSIAIVMFQAIGNLAFDSSIISNTAIYLYVSNQAKLIQSLGSLIAARQISGIEFIQGNVALLFQEDSHLKWIFVFILPSLGIIGIFIPFSLFICLFLNKKKFNQSSFRKHFCYLYNEYNKDSYFWEQIKIWKKSAIIIILTYFETSTAIKAFLVSLTLLCYEFYAVIHRPYITKNLNTLDIESGFIVLAAIFIAAIKSISDQTSPKEIETLLQVILILLCVRLCFYFISNIINVYYKKHSQALFTNFYSLLQNIKKDSLFSQFVNQVIMKRQRKNEKLAMHFHQLRQYLLQISKQQIEQLRSTNLPSPRIHTRQLSELLSNRINTGSKLILLTKEDR